jgi:hypothetical protein
MKATGMCGPVSPPKPPCPPGYAMKATGACGPAMHPKPAGADCPRGQTADARGNCRS